MEKIIKSIKNDHFGHESWILIGNEQHKKYWWAAIGDCSNWNIDVEDFMLADKRKQKLKLEPAIVLKDATYKGLLKKIHQEIKKR